MSEFSEWCAGGEKPEAATLMMAETQEGRGGMAWGCILGAVALVTGGLMTFIVVVEALVKFGQVMWRVMS